MSTVLDRLEKLESVISCNSVTLTDPQNPNCKVKIELNGGQYTVTKILTTTEVLTEETPLTSVNLNQ